LDPGTTPTGMSVKYWKNLDQKEKSTIWLCLLDSVFLNVLGETITKELWDKLETLYQSKSMVKKKILRNKLYNLRMKDGDSMSENLNAFNTMNSINIKISDEDKCINLLFSFQTRGMV
jgi:hypothetical protein